jgi:hypothetical protein
MTAAAIAIASPSSSAATMTVQLSHVELPHSPVFCAAQENGW